MKKLLLLCIFACFPTLALASQVALVIGNSKYTSVAELSNPGNDSAAMAAALRDQGFTVLHRDDLGQIEMRRTLRDFRAMADTAEIALIFYAGHGIEISGQNYLVPIDARLEDERDASVELINMDVLLRQISGARTLKMVVLDACRNNPFVVKMQRDDAGRNVGLGLADIETSDTDTLIAYAAAAGEVTPDGITGGNSPFTEAFLTALNGPPRDVRRLLGTVRDEMRKKVPGSTPFVYSSLGGTEYVINPKNSAPPPEPVAAVAAPDPTPVPEPAPQVTAADTQALISDYVAADMVGTRGVWDAFLERHKASSSNLLYGIALTKRSAVVEAERSAAASGSESAPVSAPAPDPVAKPAPAPQTQTAALAEPVPVPAPIVRQPAPEPVPDPVAAPAPEPVPMIPEAEAAKAALADLQQVLLERKCYQGAVDGLYGRQSEAAISRMSEALGTELKVSSRPLSSELLAALDRISQSDDVDCPAAVVAAPAPRSANTGAARPSRKRQCVEFAGVVTCQ